MRDDEVKASEESDENKRMQSERNKKHREKFEGERESRKGTNFWKVGITDVAPTKNVSFFSLSGEVR